MQRLRRAAILLVCLVLVSGILASCSSDNTSAAAGPNVPLSAVTVIGGVLCPEGDTCQNYTTGEFTAAGPFAVMWLCYGRSWKNDSVALSISVYDGVGHQIDNLNEICPSGRDTGTIMENQPAGKYSASLTESGGPAASVVILSTLASASQ